MKMMRKWLIIPEYSELEYSVSLAKEYGAAFEYNDFYEPAVYDDADEVKKRIGTYKILPRERSEDTLHGVFYDIAFTSQDSVIRNRSRELIRQSMQIAQELEIRGVVFHTGLIPNLMMESYVNPWLEEAEKFWRNVAGEFPDLEIYMENTFERRPDVLIRLKERLSDVSSFQLCLDYGHACVTPTPVDEWTRKFSRYIGHLHLNDNDLLADLHAVPGDGCIDWNHCRELFEQYHITAPALLELRGLERQRRALEFMKALWQK